MAGTGFSMINKDLLTPALLLLGAVLLALTLAARPVGRLPVSPALIYLLVGWFAGLAFGAPSTADWVRLAPEMTVASEFVILLSLFAVGLRLTVPSGWQRWRPALLLAGPAMVLTIAVGSVLAVGLLGLPWPVAMLLAAILSPTDPVLASDVQIRSDADRDTLRMTLTAEGGMNDGSALPAVMLALGWMGLHDLGAFGASWWIADFAWPIGGGALVGVAMGYLLGRTLRWSMDRGDKVVRDELLYVGAVALAYGVSLSLALSAFVVSFAMGATLLVGLGSHLGEDAARRGLRDRLHGDAGRSERLVEAVVVMAIGVALAGVMVTWPIVLFALGFIVVARPLAVYGVIRARTMHGQQRRLAAWFGIRGIGTLFYLFVALDHGLAPDIAETLASATLVCIALSIVLHGVSATPLMALYQKRVAPGAAEPPAEGPAA